VTGLSEGDLAAIALSLRVSLVATVAILPVAFLAALVLARGRFVGKALLDAVIHLPLVLPPVATGFALLILFGKRGVIGESLAKAGIVFAFDWTGAALAAAIMAFPLIVRPIRLSIEAIDREVDEVARTLGGRFWTRLWRVVIPLASPGVLAGAVLGFAKALGEFGATITFVGAIPGESLTLPAAIYAATQFPGGEGRAFTLCIVAAALSLVAVLISDAVAKAVARRIG
jgi:molybdate transport system permease protein